MQEKQIGKWLFKAKPISFKAVLDKSKEGNPDARWMIEKSITEPTITDQLLEEMTFQEGNQLTKFVNEVNGLEGFQTSPTQQNLANG